METQKVMCNKILAIKNWLTRAEENFNNQNNLQGEINLLLAQAEMEHLKEKKKINLKKYILINIVALILLTSGIIYLKDDIFAHRIVKFEKNERQEQKNDIINKVEQKLPQNAVVVQTQNLVVDRQKQTIIAKDAKEPLNDKIISTIITDQQKQDLVRMAGKVLRSNN